MKRKQTSPTINATSEFNIATYPVEEVRRVVTIAAAGPHLAAARVVLAAEGSKGIGENIAHEELGRCLLDQGKAINRGDMTHVEAMLMSQATALQTMFVRLTEMGMVQKHLPYFDAHMRLALRAQNQCRATLETLSAIKNPPVVFAKQANINQVSGNQQVNNGTPATASRTERIINPQNELLEVQHGGETVEIRTTGETIRKDKAMAAVD